MNEVLQIISALWPVFVGFIGLVIILAKMHYNIETLTEKVKVLFDFHNKNKEKWKKLSTVKNQAFYQNPESKHLTQERKLSNVFIR